MTTLRAYLQLVRFPAVFTAMADILCGAIVAGGMNVSWRDVALLLASSSAIYLGGMSANDAFDVGIDAVERPKRPIPSGRVPLRRAWLLTAALFAAGIIFAAVVGTSSLLIAASLVMLVLLYDGVLKSTALGPFAMGGCRSLNILLGASTAAVVWARPQTHVALALGLYIVGVTWFARQEATGASRVSLIRSAIVIHLGLAAFFAIPAFGLVQLNAVQLNAAVALLALLLVMLWIDTRVVKAIAQPEPVNIQLAVKQMLQAIILLDTTTVGYVTGNWWLALVVSLLLIPAMTLGRYIFIT